MVCSISHGEYRSYTVGFSASVTPWGWTSAGFDVSMSVETGNSWTCEGGPGSWFAVWKSQAQTAYTVTNYRQDPCIGNTESAPFVMWSPNSNDRGAYYYCVQGRDYVRNVGDSWVDYNGRAGGP